MKLILTEQQLNNVLINERMEYLVLESLNESLDFKTIRKKIRKALMVGISATLLLSSVNNMDIPQSEKESLKNFIESFEGELADTKGPEELTNDTIFNQKVEACRAYMEYALNNQGYTMESTGLDPEQLVKTCQDNDFSLPFTMAVAHLESCFGANDRAQRTNSVFSVGSYDNGKNVCTYSDPNQSIQPFINLIKSDYISDKKDLDALLNPGNFVNGSGNRYAKRGNYESQVKSIINKITRMYPILSN